jgi:hypothetical protein
MAFDLSRRGFLRGLGAALMAGTSLSGPADVALKAGDWISFGPDELLIPRGLWLVRWGNSSYYALTPFS